MACAITLLVELVFAGLGAGDELVRSIAERLVCVEELLNSYTADRSVEKKTEKEITHLGMVGTSRLRRFLRRSTYSLHTRANGAVVALVEDLWISSQPDISSASGSDDDRKRMRSLVRTSPALVDLLSGKFTVD